MRAEYLLFDLLVLAGPLALSLWPRANFRARARSILWACLVVGVPFVLWDAAVTPHHWWFDERYTLGPTLLGLPFEEVLFFLAVPYACAFSWETLIGGERATLRPRGGGCGRWIYAIAAALVPAGVALWWTGLEYTGATAMALGSVAILDHALGCGVLRTRRYLWFCALVVVFTAVFNTYLTARPVVHYNSATYLGIRLGSVPIEDFGYGVALATGVVVVFQWHQMRGLQPSWAARLIERGFGGYRHTLGKVDTTLPTRAQSPARVAVVGGGLAGLSTASMLAKRGLSVTLLEKNPYLGGKVAAWTETLDDGFDASIEHGFHAFFRHYYNLDDWLGDIGVRTSMRGIGEYTILTEDGRRLSFADKPEAPILNLLGLARRGLYNLWDVARGPAGQEMEAFMRYQADKTFRDFDDEPFSAFADRASLPADLRIVFNTFSRAFFSDDDRLSTAELIKSFHFYYLSHDRGLGYDFVDGGYAEALVDPIAAYCESHGVVLRTSCPVNRLERPGDGPGWVVNGDRFDHVVVAADVGAARAILGESVSVQREAPELVAALDHVRPGQGYAVLRLWLDAPAPTDLPVFVSTERPRAGIIDAAAFVDRIDPAAASWAAAQGGSVVELHCYAVPEGMAQGEVRDGLIAGMRAFFPQLADARVHHEHLQLRDDFTAFHVGMGRHRPTVTTEMPDLFLAGDWVKLPCPAMLMEAAHTSGRLAANAILKAEGVQGYPVYTVPLEGLLTKLPQRPQPKAQAATAAAATTTDS